MPGQGNGFQLTVVDLADGNVRRTFECADLPAYYSLTVGGLPDSVALRGHRIESSGR